MVFNTTSTHHIGVNVMEGSSAAEQMGNTITTLSNDVIVIHCLLLDRNGLGPLNVMVYIDWKGLAYQEHGSRTISRGVAPCKALFQSPTILRHYSIQRIKAWVGKCTNSIMLVWASWHVNYGLSLDEPCMWNCSWVISPTIGSSYPKTQGKLLLMGKQWWRNKIQEEMLVQDLEASLTLSSQSDQQVTRMAGQESNWVGML